MSRIAAMPGPTRRDDLGPMASRRVAWLGLGGWLSFMVVLAFHYWTVGSNGRDLSIGGTQKDYYNLLVEGFLQGRLSLAVDPDPRLLALENPYDPIANAPFRIAGAGHDLSLFEGRYYTYFGVTPAVLFFLPFRILTGHGAPLEVVTALNASFGTLFMTLAVGGLWRLGGLRQAKGLGAAALMVFAWSSALPFVLRRPAIYEAAVVTGFLCVALASWATVRAIESQSLAGLAFASFAAGLAVGCRPVHVVTCLVPVIAARALQRQGHDEPLKVFIAAAAPACLVVGLILGYNFARFGEFLEFGQNYFLYDYQRGENSPSMRFVPVNLWIQLFSPPSLGPEFPFFRMEPRWLPTLPEGYLIVDRVAGTLACAPIGLLCLLAPFVDRSKKVLRTSAICGLLAGLATAAAVATFPASAARYAVDSGPYLIAAALLVWGGLWSNRPGRGFLAASFMAVGAQVVVNTFLSFSGNSDWLKDRNGEVYTRIANAFMPVQRVWFTLSPNAYGPARITLRFPQEPTEKSQVLLAAGGLYRHNALCVDYIGRRRLRLRFHQRGGNPPLESEILRFDPAHRYTLEIEMGSLYPVDRTTLEKLYPGRGLFRKAEELRVRLDGVEVLSNSYDFVPSAPERVTFGRETVDPQYCSAPFSGEILTVTRGFP